MRMIKLSPKGVGLFLLKLTVTGTLLVVLFREVDLETFLTALSRNTAAALIGALALLVVQAWLSALRWMAAARTYGHPLPMGRASVLFLSSLFYNQVLPSTVAGDAVRIFGAHRAGAPMRAAIAGVVLDRLLTVVVLATLAGVSFLVAPERILASTVNTMLFVGCLGFLIAVAFAAPIARRVSRYLLKDLCDKLVQHYTVALGILHPPRRGLYIFALSTVIHLLSIGVLYILEVDLDVGVPFWTFCWSMPVVLLLALVPIAVNGWGVREGAMVAVLAPLGVPVTTAVAISVTYGILQFILAVGSGGISLIGLSRQGLAHER